MSRLLLVLLAIVAGTVCVADDPPALKPAPKDAPSRKMLSKALLAECQKHFDTRKAEVANLLTPTQIGLRQAELKEKFVAALGGSPEKTPLNAKVVGTLKREGYRVEKIIYESRPEHHVTANLYVPEGQGPFPGVLMPIGHSQNGKAADYVQRGCILLVKNGFVVLTYDPIGQGERSQLLDKLGNPAIKGSTSEHTMCGVGALLVGRSTASYRVWDGIRSIEYLASRPEVDRKKLGCTGCSGGGTLTSYLMALDDRIQAAAPSCYVTSLERLFATIGPQDAEQNITGQVAFRMEHADYILMRAPKPTLICAAANDFFDPQGTWDTFREAKRIYGRFGFSERVDVMVSEGGHGYPKSHREAVARFMSRWLKDDDRAIVEGEFPIEKDKDLLCTRSGQVLEDLKGQSVFDLNAAMATELAKKRTPALMERAAFRNVVGRILRLPRGEPYLVSRSNPWQQGNPRVSPRRNGDAIGEWTYLADNLFVPFPALHFPETAKERDQNSPVIYVDNRGKEAETGPDGAIHKYRKSGKDVLAVDLRGWGETAPGVAEPGKTPVFGLEYKEAFLSLHLNRPLLGQRVWDLLGVVEDVMKWKEPKEEIALVGVGSAAVAVLHVAALDDRIWSVTIENCLPSWDLVVRAPISHDQLANAVPGALAVYDLPDLAAFIAPRPLTIRNPVDAAGKPLTKEAAEEAYKDVRAAYKAAGAADKLMIEVGARK